MPAKLTPEQEQRFDDSVYIPCQMVDGDFCDNHTKKPMYVDDTGGKRIVGYEVYPKGECACGMEQVRIEAKQHLAKELQTQREELPDRDDHWRMYPMGISQWKEHGKKYGYWKHFESEAKEELKAKFKQIIGEDDILYGFGNMEGRDPSDDYKARNQLRAEQRKELEEL